MNRAVSAVIMLLFGAALTLLGSSDKLLLYVRASSRKWVLITGITMILLAIWTLWSARRHDSQVDVHGHGGSAKASWLVLLPTLVIIGVAPPALGSFTAGRAPTLDPSSRAIPTAPTGEVTSLLTLYLLANQAPARIVGRPVSIEGFVQRTTTGGFLLSRLVITCCAADAFAVNVEVTATGPVPPVNSWVRVSGVVSGSRERTPQLTATGVTPIPTPADPYG